jgi:adenylate cyclase class 1
MTKKTGFLKRIFHKIASLLWKTEKTEDEIKLEGFFVREQNYTAYNTDKLNKILKLLPLKKREVFKLIPILLCCNDKSLPGYIYSRKPMQGMAKFTLSSEGKRLILKYFKRSNLKAPDSSSPAIELFALIGSIGSVAQTELSDFDFWVCTNFDNFNQEQISLFKTKLDLIEKWARKVGDLEVHFFLMDIKKVHSNDFGESGRESSGTALCKLLKEEFYRTATYINGKLPYWCIIPADDDDDAYEEDVDFLQNHNDFSSKNYLDIGNVYRISKNEFFGAALWEIVKGWRFPFKSILKMALLEKYLSSDLTSDLLCNNLKRNVLKKPHDLRNDPYILLFDSILSFYKTGGNVKDLEMIKTCFYIKTHLKGSEIINAESPNDIKDGRTKQYFNVLKDYLKEFNWDMETNKHLEAFNEWTVKDTNNFLSKIDNSMLHMYRRIMKIVKLGENFVISETDLTIIGRKIHSIFRKAPHKIPFIASVHASKNIGSIVLHQEQKKKWYLYFGTKRVLNPLLTMKDIVYSAEDIFEILGWVALNEYYKSNLYLFVKSVYSNYSTNELKVILNNLQSKFFPLDISSIPSNELLEKENVKKLYIIPNFSEEISSSINNLHVFYLSSWGEFFYKKFEGMEPTVSFCNNMIANIPFKYKLFKNDTDVYLPKKVVGVHTSANKKLQNMLFQMSEALHHNKDEDVFSRFITIIDEKISVFYLKDGLVKISYFKHLYSLYKLFELPTYKKKVLTIVDNLHNIGHLKIMSDLAKYGQVNIMLTPKKNNKTEVIIIDEVGNINYYGTIENNELPYSLSHFKVFAGNALKRTINKDSASPFYKASDIPIKFYKLSSEGNKFYTLDCTKVVNQNIKNLSLNPIQLKVTRGINKKGEDGYIVSLCNETIDDSEYPDILGELRNRIKDLRGSRKSYEVFITELSLDKSFKEKFCPTFSSLSHFLIYKKILESKLSMQVSSQNT